MVRWMLAWTLLVLPLAPAAMAAETQVEKKPQPYTGPKWEYRIETFIAGSVDGLPGAVAKVVMSGLDGQRLEELGKEGWELVSVTGGRAYFKRQLKEPETHDWWPFW